MCIPTSRPAGWWENAPRHQSCSQGPWHQCFCVCGLTLHPGKRQPRDQIYVKGGGGGDWGRVHGHGCGTGPNPSRPAGVRDQVGSMQDQKEK